MTITMQPIEAAQILGVGKAKNFRLVRKRWRELASKNHPDKNPDRRQEAQDAFKRYLSAYQVLQKYTKAGGQWPIPRGYTAPQEPRFQPPPRSNTGQRNTGHRQQHYQHYHYHQTQQRQQRDNVRARTSQGGRRRWWQQVDSPPETPYPQTEKRDRSWRKNKQPAGDPFSFQAGYVYGNSQPNTLVHRDSFNEKLNRYLNQVFPDEATADQRLKAAYGQNIQVGDVKDILVNHQYGNGPIKVEYTPMGRRVSWDNGPAAPTPPQGAPPEAPKQTSGPVYGGNPIQGSPQQTTNGAPVYGAPPTQTTLRVHPLAYERWFHASRGTGTPTLLPSILTSGSGANTGHFMVSFVGATPHVNGVPCSIVLDSNAPVR